MVVATCTWDPSKGENRQRTNTEWLVLGLLQVELWLGLVLTLTLTPTTQFQSYCASHPYWDPI